MEFEESTSRSARLEVYFRDDILRSLRAALAAANDVLSAMESLEAIDVRAAQGETVLQTGHEPTPREKKDAYKNGFQKGAEFVIGLLARNYGPPDR